MYTISTYDDGGCWGFAVLVFDEDGDMVEEWEGLTLDAALERIGALEEKYVGAKVDMIAALVAEGEGR